MRKLFSTKYSASAFNLAMLILRIGFGGLVLPHGYDKLVNFAANEKAIINFLGIGQTMSLVLLIFSEFFCSLFVMLGLFTRFATIPLIFSMTVAVTIAHKGQIFGEGEHAALFAVGFLALLLVGPGKVSVDGMIGK